jgi:hypothetical protein
MNMGLFDKFKSKSKQTSASASKEVAKTQLTKAYLQSGKTILVDIKAIGQLWALDYDGRYELRCNRCGTQFDSAAVRSVIASSLMAGYKSQIVFTSDPTKHGQQVPETRYNSQQAAILAGKCPVCSNRSMAVTIG